MYKYYVRKHKLNFSCRMQVCVVWQAGAYLCKLWPNSTRSSSKCIFAQLFNIKFPKSSLPYEISSCTPCDWSVYRALILWSYMEPGFPAICYGMEPSLGYNDLFETCISTGAHIWHCSVWSPNAGRRVRPETCNSGSGARYVNAAGP